jgi:ribosomal protein S18 acetylase RimI-like enzyme
VYTLRPAKYEDSPKMMAIGHEGLRPYIEAVRGWDKEVEETGFVNHFIPELINIIQVDGRDVGYIKTEDCGEYLDIEGIYIEKRARSLGLGGRVLTDLISSTDKALQLRVYKVNPAADLYRRLGFKVIKEEDDAFIMRREAGI